MSATECHLLQGSGSSSAPAKPVSFIMGPRVRWTWADRKSMQLSQPAMEPSTGPKLREECNLVSLACHNSWRSLCYSTCFGRNPYARPIDHELMVSTGLRRAHPNEQDVFLVSHSAMLCHFCQLQLIPRSITNLGISKPQEKLLDHLGELLP